jgi:septum formation protein
MSSRELGRIDLILASTSRYRRELLMRLTETFRPIAPDVDETAQPGEEAVALAIRLADAKASDVAERHPNCVVIGSDQVAECERRILGKPGDAETARNQLRACSGNSVAFHTAICVIDDRGELRRAIDTTRVYFRTLSDREIDRYIEREKPFDCAGSFKVESLGIALFDRIESDDPTALIGLPLIALCRLLRESGIEVF